MKKDQEILAELIGKEIPIENFEDEITKIMKKRSSAKLWWSNIPDTIRDEKGDFHKVNYRCIPESSQCKNMFCLVLSHTNGMVHIKEGYLEEV